jgi:PAS domain S-box-containing protein
MVHAGGAFFRRGVESCQDVVYLLDGQGIVRYVNPAVTDILGYEAADVIGTDSLEGVHPDDLASAGAAWQDLLAGNVTAASCRVQKRDGTWCEMEWAGTNLLDDPEVRGVVVIARDVTGLRGMERELRRLEELTARGLASQLAHDFNNVLMGIQPLVEVIRRRYAADERLMRMTETMVAALARGKGLIRNVQEVLRASAATSSTIGVDARTASEAIPGCLRALLVEDDEAVAAGIVSLLESENIEVRLARSGLDVPPLLESFEPQIIILDVTLPDMGGREIYEGIVRTRPDIPVIFSTGCGSESEIEPCLKIPNVAFLSKPYTIAELMAAIEKLTGGRGRGSIRPAAAPGALIPG